MKLIECEYRATGVGKKLSNLYPHPGFYFRGRIFGSMEGLLQSLKFKDADRALEISQMSGTEAYFAGQKGNSWQKDQTLWFDGEPINRQSSGYQKLISSAYDHLACCPTFERAIVSTGNNLLLHSIGNHDTHFTVLTASEYLMQLYRVRSYLLAEYAEQP